MGARFASLIRSRLEYCHASRAQITVTLSGLATVGPLRLRELGPAYGTDYGRSAFERYLTDRGADPNLVRLVSDRVSAPNETIRNHKELGRGFQIGHSYFAPDDEDPPPTDAWYRRAIETQIAPLLREYWFDSPENVQNEVAKLTAGT